MFMSFDYSLVVCLPVVFVCYVEKLIKCSQSVVSCVLDCCKIARIFFNMSNYGTLWYIFRKKDTFATSQIYRLLLKVFVLDHMLVLSVSAEIHAEKSEKKRTTTMLNMFFCMLKSNFNKRAHILQTKILQLFLSVSHSPHVLLHFNYKYNFDYHIKQ